MLITSSLFFWGKCKNEEITILKTRLNTADTQKKVDLVEAEVKEKLENVNKSKKYMKELSTIKESIDLKRKEIKVNKTDKEILDYWND